MTASLTDNAGREKLDSQFRESVVEEKKLLASPV
jgi:hypothetical protein